jgi:heterotetrameric sarcosine oxidase gamma subunit
VTLEFLSVDQAADGAVARSPIERALRRAGARLELRDGWNVAADFGSVDDELRACLEAAGLAESSHLRKLELQGPADALAEIVGGATGGGALEAHRALLAHDAWWCPVHPERVLVLCPSGVVEEVRDALERAAAEHERTSLVEVTTGMAAFTVVGPLAREVLARLSALDTRPGSLGEQAFAPVSVGRVPAMVLRENGDRFLVLFGSAYADYQWTALTDAGLALGASIVGADALERLAAVAVEAGGA